jgi:O-acetyl-ADP-ribose deacetylase (regulator of RNase III)
MNPVLVLGDLLDQDVEVIINAWNRNIIPWWLLLPQGVSGAIKKRGGTEPFRQVAKHGPIPLGEAVLTGAGRLPFRGIIHVAGINIRHQHVVARFRNFDSWRRTKRHENCG